MHFANISSVPEKVNRFLVKDFLSDDKTILLTFYTQSLGILSTPLYKVSERSVENYVLSNLKQLLKKNAILE